MDVPSAIPIRRLVRDANDHFSDGAARFHVGNGLGRGFQRDSGRALRIKRLRGLSKPQFRLRVGEIRVFYDVTGDTVEVLAIIAKSEAESWLARFGNPE